MTRATVVSCDEDEGARPECSSFRQQALRIVEAAYGLENTNDAWMASVLDAALPVRNTPPPEKDEPS